jgi:hypothetical protein
MTKNVGDESRQVLAETKEKNQRAKRLSQVLETQTAARAALRLLPPEEVPENNDTRPRDRLVNF